MFLNLDEYLSNNDFSMAKFSIANVSLDGYMLNFPQIEPHNLTNKL
jgi:hypothetical protein